MRVATVRGEIEPEALGRTLFHEHVHFAYAGADGDRSRWTDDGSVHAAAARALADAKRTGFTTVVDVTPNDCGRDPVLLRTVAEDNDVNLVCATGYYHEAGGGSAYFGFRSAFADVTAELTELFVHELTVGIGGTGIRAGVVKVATGDGRISDYERHLLRAAGAAQRITGAPVVTHTENGTMGPEQARALVAAGADPRRVVVGHMCGAAQDLDYQRATLETGVRIGFDRVGLQRMGGAATDEDRADAVAALVAEGYGDRILLSHDFVAHWGGRDASAFHDLPGTRSWSMGRIGDHLVPLLLERGVTAEQVERMLAGNVRALWTAGE